MWVNMPFVRVQRKGNKILQLTFDWEAFDIFLTEVEE